MKQRETRWQHIGEYAGALVKWFAVGGLVGAVGGVVGSLFHIGVHYATALRLENPWILYLLPLCGVVITALYRACRVEGMGTNAVIESVHFGKNVPVALVPVIFISTVLTHLCGGSAGREGAALQIGGGIGYRAGRLLRLGEKDLPLATLCGMAGVFSALFGTPLTATVFALEVISVGALYYAGLIPCLTASLVGYLVSTAMGVAPTRFAVVMPEADVMTMVRVVALALLCGGVSILFCQGLHRVEHLAAHYIKNTYLRAAVGGMVLIGLTLLLGTDYNGAGMEVIERAMAGEARHGAWLLKLLFTAVTIGCGFKGGEVVPSFFVGA
ncbi:MAG: chloride channel protein, partial [Oscillospiraceae bacterium]|nr:chloride channel protein [Oscillospiraceae bacterium]